MTDTALIFAPNSEESAQPVNDKLAALMTIGRPSPTLGLSGKISFTDWRFVFAKIGTWFRTIQTEMGVTLLKDAMPQSSTTWLRDKLDELEGEKQERLVCALERADIIRRAAQIDAGEQQQLTRTDIESVRPAMVRYTGHYLGCYTIGHRVI